MFRKKDGSLQLVTKNCALDAVTVKNYYTLPLISKLLDQLSEAIIFSIIDLTAVYNQVHIAEKHIPKMALNQMWGIKKRCHELWHDKCPFNLCSPHEFRLSTTHWEISCYLS